MSTNQAEKLQRARSGEALQGGLVSPGRPPGSRRRRSLWAPRAAGRGAAPPDDRATALAQEDGPDPREFLQRAIAQVGPRVMAGRPMLAVFAFVEELSKLLADRWPPLRHEQACELVKQILRQGGMGFGLLTAGACHPMTGWVLNFAEQETRGERFLG